MTEDDLGGGFSIGGKSKGEKSFASIHPEALKAMASSQKEESQNYSQEPGAPIRTGLLTLAAVAGIMYVTNENPIDTYVTKACVPAEEQRHLPANNVPYLEVTLSNDNVVRADYKGQEDETVRFAHTMGGQHQPTIDYIIEVSGTEATGTVTRRNLEHETYKSNTELYRQDSGCWEVQE